MSKRNILILLLILFLGIPLLGYLGQGSRSSNISYQEGGVSKTTRGNMGMGIPAPMMAPSEDFAMEAESVSMMADRAIEPGVAPIPPFGDDGFTEGVDRTIVKNAYLGLVVEDTRQTVDQVTQVVSSTNGFVTSSNVYENQFGQGGVSADMVVRVPVDQLEGTMAQIKQFADKVVNESLTASDETEQKIDMEAQLRNLRATETQMLSILERASEIEDVLNVQRELNNIRGQIERLQARLENLEGAAAMSTLRISITTEEADLPVVDPTQPTIWEEIKIALRESVQFYRNLFVAGLRLSIVGLPLLVIGVPIWLLFRKKAK